MQHKRDGWLSLFLVLSLLLEASENFQLAFPYISLWNANKIVLKHPSQYVSTTFALRRLRIQKREPTHSWGKLQYTMKHYQLRHNQFKHCSRCPLLPVLIPFNPACKLPSRKSSHNTASASIHYPTVLGSWPGTCISLPIVSSRHFKSECKVSYRLSLSLLLNLANLFLSTHMQDIKN